MSTAPGPDLLFVSIAHLSREKPALSNVVNLAESVRKPAAGMARADLQAALGAVQSAPGWMADLVDDEGGRWVALEPPMGRGLAAFAVLRDRGAVVLHRLEDNATWAFGSVWEAVMAALRDRATG